MIILDTNVVSELVRPRPSEIVAAWIDRQDVSTLFLSSISLAELLAGIARLPHGQRRTALSNGVAGILEAKFADRILPFDEAAARAYGDLVPAAASVGRAIGIPDGQIAAIARVHRATVATRDIAPFRAAGVPTIDPWHDQA